MNYYIFKGRFQPFHNGHLEVVERSIQLMKPEDVLIIAALTKPFAVSEITDMEFGKKVSEHFLPERNLWGPLVALEAISKISEKYNGYSRIITTLMPVPNYAWNQINEWLPKNRIWIIPDAGEAFDNDKAEFYLRQNEHIIRIPDNSGVSGKELREAYLSDNYTFFSQNVPDILLNTYWKKMEEVRNLGRFDFICK